MKVSAIVIAHNEEKWIGDCLKRLTDQEVKADEIIVVDNNCTDNTIKVAEKFKVRTVSESKQGMIYARNRGFNSAKYDLLVRCDADTLVPRDWIKKIKQNFQNRKIDALSGPIEFYDLPKFLVNKVFSEAYSNGSKKMYHHDVLIGPNMSLTKQIWEKVKDDVCLKDCDVHEDVDLSIHIARAGGKIFLDHNLISDISARRIKNDPISFFLEYPYRQIKTRYKHLKPTKSQN